MNKFFSILVISLVASISLVAETKVFSSKDFSSTVKIVEKNKVITTIGAGRVTSNERFFIDKDTKYNLKITARKVKGSPDFYCHIGFILCDEGMVELQPVFYRAEYYTESTIVNDVKENSNIIVINKPKNFPKDILRRYWHVAFDIKNHHQDLPNRNVIRIKKVEELPNNQVKLTLFGKVIKDYKKGSPIRFHSPGPLMYSLINGKSLDYNWKSYSVDIKGISNHQGLNNFWKDAAFFKVVIVNSARTPDRNVKMEFKDFVLTTMEK